MDDLLLDLVSLIQRVGVRAQGAPSGWKKDCLIEVNEWLSKASERLSQGVELEQCAEALIQGLQEMSTSVEHGDRFLSCAALE